MRQARLGSRAAAAAGSRASSSSSPAASTRGAAARTASRDASMPARPPRLDQRGGLGGDREPGQQRGAARVVGPQQQHLPHVRVGGPGLGVQVVTVVPHRHQAEVRDRRERGGSGADDDLDLTPAHRQPAPVARLGAELGREHDVAPRAQPRRQRRVDARDVTVIRYDDEAAPAGVQAGPGRRRQCSGPVLARQRHPHRPRSGARAPAHRGRTGRADSGPTALRWAGVRARGVARVPGPARPGHGAAGTARRSTSASEPA